MAIMRSYDRTKEHFIINDAPTSCNVQSSVLNSKEVGRREAPNTDQELIFKSVFNSPCNKKSKTRTDAYTY